MIPDQNAVGGGSVQSEAHLLIECGRYMKDQVLHSETARRDAAANSVGGPERATAEEQPLQSNEELLRLLLENSSDGVNVCELHVEGGRPTRRLVFCNERFVEMSGRSREELMACGDLNALTHEHYPMAEDNRYLAEIRAGRACQGVGSWTRPDGKPNAHEWVAVPMPMRGKIYLLGVDRDVTERNRALAALEKERNEALAIFNSAPIAIWCKDTENRILRLNSEAARAMGMRASDVIGREALELHSPEDAAAYHADDLEVIRSGIPKLGIVESVASPSGEVHWVRTDKVPTHDEHGQINGVIVFAHDITALKKAEEDRLLAERSLQQAQKAQSLGALAGGVAHDFNNLLTSVLGKVSLASAALPAASPVQRHLQGIESASRRAAELCQQMLAYSGHGRLDLQSVDLHAFVEESLPLLHLSIGRGVGLELTPLAPGEILPAVQIDLDQLRRTLVSLVTNAAEACEDKPDGVIHLCTGFERNFDFRWWSGPNSPEADLPPGDYVFVEIADNGCGMSDEVRARMFDPFFSTKFTGRGLGLAAAAGIVRSHGGALRARSEPGQGALFRVLLPCVEAPVTTNAASADDAIAPTPPSAGFVLIVDDEEPIRHMTASMLDILGFSSLQTGSGAEALALFEKNAPAITAVLLDITQSKVGGETILRQFRDCNPEVKVVFVGAPQTRLGAASASKDGTAFLKKPFTVDALRETLQKLTPTV